MYQVACDINNVDVVTVPLNKNFQIDAAKTLNAVKKNTKMIFLCSPNNPTGNLLNRRSILKIASKFQGIVVIDEAYIDFCSESTLISEVGKFQNLVVTRTFSKAWGLAGVRCGYSVANEFITELLFKVKAPYNISKLTSKTVLDSIKNVKKKEGFDRKLNGQRFFLIEEMRKIKGVRKILKTDSNFITFKVDDAKKVFSYLASEGIIIRDRSSQLNLDNCLRVSVGTPKENKLFIKKLKEVL
jgi:histidinol-phosphate aminotransferase